MPLANAVLVLSPMTAACETHVANEKFALCEEVALGSHSRKAIIAQPLVWHITLHPTILVHLSKKCLHTGMGVQGVGGIGCVFSLMFVDI